MEIKATTLDDIAAVVGFAATVRLCAWYGDASYLYVPLKVDGEHHLVRLIGRSAANRLSKEWGGEHLAIPSSTGYDQAVRYKMIGFLITKGCTAREVAQLVHVSPRRVQQVCRELEAAGLIPVIARKTARENTQEKAGTVFQPPVAC